MHFLETHDLPHITFGVERQIGVLDLAGLESAGLGSATAFRSVEAILTREHGEVGKGDILGIASCHGGRAYLVSPV